MAKQMHIQDLPRVNQMAGVLARNGFGHLLGLVGLTPPVRAAAPDSRTAPSARRVRKALVELGPTFIKLGQILSVRPDILTPDLMEEFQTLQDQVPPMPFDDVQRVVEGELRAGLHEVFSEFDPEPLGSASIAQVHRARLRDSGEEVAVKLQRRGIASVIESDIHILYSLGHILERNHFDLPGLYTPTAIVREFETAISQELDFLLELKSAERMARNFASGEVIRVPGTFPRWSTKRMMVMELIEGRSLREVMKTATPELASRLAHQIMEATYQQVYDHGFFHGDPHPGNLMVTPQGELVYLDFGIVGTLTGAMQETIIGSFTSMVFRDAEALALVVYRAGATRDRVDLRAFTEDLEKKMLKYYGATLDDLAQISTFIEVVQLCTKYQIVLPPEFAILSRVIGLVEGECRALLPGVDIIEEVKPYAQRLVAQRFSPERIGQDVARAMLLVQGHFRELPTQMNQVLMDLEGGKLEISTRDPESASLRDELRAIGDEIRSAVLRLALAALASTITLGALMFLAVWSPTPFGIPIFGLLGMLSLWVGLAIFGAVGVHVFFARFFSFSWWRRKVTAIVRFFSWRRS